MPYASDVDFKARQDLAPGVSADRVAAVLDAATTAVASYCRRDFAVPTATSVRLYAAPDNGDDVLYVHDIANVTGLVVADNGVTLVSGTDFQLEPLGGFWPSGLAGAFTSLRRISGAWYLDPRGAAKVSVTAMHGWPAIPAPVVEATMLIAADLWAGKDARFGVTGFADGGYARVRENALACSLLDPFVSYARAGIA